MYNNPFVLASAQYILLPSSPCRPIGLFMLMTCSTYTQFTPMADIPSRQRLRSSSSDDLLISAIKLPTIGRRAVLVAGVRTWNDFSLVSSHLQKTTKTASVSTFIS